MLYVDCVLFDTKVQLTVDGAQCVTKVTTTDGRENDPFVPLKPQECGKMRDSTANVKSTNGIVAGKYADQILPLQEKFLKRPTVRKMSLQNCVKIHNAIYEAYVTTTIVPGYKNSKEQLRVDAGGYAGEVAQKRHGKSDHKEVDDHERAAGGACEVV